MSPASRVLLLSLLTASAIFGHDGVDQAAEAARLRPDDAARWVRLARLQLGDHADWQGCLVSVEKASRLDAQMPLDTLRAEALAVGGKLDAALALMAEHLVAHPADATAWMNQARWQRQSKQWDAAIVSGQKFIELTPNPQPDHVWELAETLNEAGKPNEALALLDRFGKTPALAERAIRLAVVQKNWDEALGRLDVAMSQAPLQEPWLAKKAALLEQAGRKADAVAVWQNLQQRIAAMPARQRSSHAMSQLSEQCSRALATER